MTEPRARGPTCARAIAQHTRVTLDADALPHLGGAACAPHLRLDPPLFCRTGLRARAVTGLTVRFDLLLLTELTCRYARTLFERAQRTAEEEEGKLREMRCCTAVDGTDISTPLLYCY